MGMGFFREPVSTLTFGEKSSRELQMEDSFAMGAGILLKPITSTHEKRFMNRESGKDMK